MSILLKLLLAVLGLSALTGCTATAKWDLSVEKLSSEASFGIEVDEALRDLFVGPPSPTAVADPVSE